MMGPNRAGLSPSPQTSSISPPYHPSEAYATQLALRQVVTNSAWTTPTPVLDKGMCIKLCSYGILFI